jgi:hypothetical protein
VTNESLRSGSERLRQGRHHDVFGLLGDGQMKWWSAIAKHPRPKTVDVRDEGAAVTTTERWAMRLV